MFLLDLLAKYGPYAFVLMGLWFCAAFVVAAWRVRRFRTRKIVLSLVGTLLYFAFCIFMPMMMMNGLSLARIDIWFQLLTYLIFFLYMLMPSWNVTHTKRRSLPAWRAAGYRYLIDVLFFRPPYTTGPVEAAPPSEEERRIGRLTFWFMLDLAVLGLIIIFLFTTGHFLVQDQMS